MKIKKARTIELKALISQYIKPAKKILIATHENPDGDGIGSIIALGNALRRMGKKVVLYCKDPVPKMYQYLPEHKKIVTKINPKDKFDVSFLVDLGELERVGTEFKDFPARGVTISLDHHARGVHNADYNFCLPKQASSGEVIFKILKALKAPLNKTIAVNLYTAMVTDTGSFKYSNTTAESFEIAAELSRYGIDYWQVALNCFETYSLERMDLLQRVMATLTIEPSQKIASVVVSLADLKASGASPDESEGFINYPRSMAPVEVAIAFKEVAPEQYKVSLRSKAYADVARVAESFNGGGHIRASGCKVKGSLAEVKKQVIKAIEAELKRHKGQ